MTLLHQQFKARLSRNQISEITSTDGTVLKGFSQVKQVLKTYFENLYTEEGIGNEQFTTFFISRIPSLVSEDNNASLLKFFSEEEIENVVWSMEPDKALGPDGFSIHFYRACWTIIKANLLIMVKYFQQKAKVGGSTNSTFLSLIPKEVNPTTFDRFIPISLCNASYKFLSNCKHNKTPAW